MTKTLYIHIGHYKTGTTALQILLDENHAFLARHGVQYAPCVRTDSKHSDLAFAMLREAGVKMLMHGYRRSVTPLALWGTLFDQVRESPQDKVVISSEELMRIGGFDAARLRLRDIAALAGDISVKVIAYLRNPRDHLQSWHNQLVKMGIPVADFDTALNGGIERVHLDYSFALRPWVEAFGAENLILRDYDQARRSPKGLYVDFLGILGVPFSEELTLPGEDPNPRLDDRALDLVRLMQNAGMPQHSVSSTRIRATRYLAQQDKIQAARSGAAEAVQAGIRAGLDGLEALDSNIDLATFRTHLPEQADDGQTAQNLMTGFVLSELINLRMRVNKVLPALNDRLEALETRLGITSPERETED